jgi:hypothetical protein
MHIYVGMIFLKFAIEIYVKKFRLRSTAEQKLALAIHIMNKWSLNPWIVVTRISVLWMRSCSVTSGQYDQYVYKTC